MWGQRGLWNLFIKLKSFQNYQLVLLTTGVEGSFRRQTRTLILPSNLFVIPSTTFNLSLNVLRFDSGGKALLPAAAGWFPDNKQLVLVSSIPPPNWLAATVNISQCTKHILNYTFGWCDNSYMFFCGFGLIWSLVYNTLYALTLMFAHDLVQLCFLVGMMVHHQL